MSKLREVFDLFRVPVNHRAALSRYFNRRETDKPISDVVRRHLMNPGFLCCARRVLTANFLEEMKRVA